MRDDPDNLLHCRVWITPKGYGFQAVAVDWPSCTACGSTVAAVRENLAREVARYLWKRGKGTVPDEGPLPTDSRGFATAIAVEPEMLLEAVDLVRHSGRIDSGGFLALEHRPSGKRCAARLGPGVNTFSVQARLMRELARAVFGDPFRAVKVENSKGGA
jgi:hypothetical protein